MQDHKSVHTHVSWVSRAVTSRRLLAQPLTADGQPPKTVLRWVKRVNKLLHSGQPKARWSGTVLLELTARQCSPQVFVSHCNSWFGSAARVLVSTRLGVSSDITLPLAAGGAGQPPRTPKLTRPTRHLCQLLPRQRDSEATTVVACEAITCLAQHCHQHAQLKREVSSQQLTALWKSLLQILRAKPAAQDTTLAVLSCCSALCRFFPGASRTHVSAVRGAATKLFADGRQEIRQGASACFAAAARCAASKVAADSWRTTMLSVLGSLHAVFSALLDGLGV